jgi:hypothetical protein
MSIEKMRLWEAIECVDSLERLYFDVAMFRPENCSRRPQRPHDDLPFRETSINAA